MDVNFASVDYETYYDDECSITTLGTDGYILHPKFDAYLVVIVTDDWEWVGHPSEAPWDKIAGPDWEWCAHNASFDERVHYYLRKWGKVPDLSPRLWHCTADLCAFHAVPRALDRAVLFLYELKHSKSIRDRMKGKLFSALSPEKQQEVKDYALGDGRYCKRIWHDKSPSWPEKERRLSRMSREQGWRGLRLDKDGLEKDISLLKRLIWKSECMIPWHGSAATLAYESLVQECVKAGIPAPTSTAMTSEDCAAWEDQYGDQYPWVDAMRAARRANALLQKCQTMYNRIRESDGRMPYQNKYFGAHTGRWGDGGEDTGRNKDGGFNSRNLTRKEMFGEDYFLGKLDKKTGTRAIAEGKRFADMWTPGMRGVNLRHRIIPAEGCHFGSGDLAQIEPRVLWAFAGMTDALELCRQGLSPYEAHAISSMGWTGGPLKKLAETDVVALGLYQLAKARVLALGYGAGWVKFIQMARQYVSEEEARRIFSMVVTDLDKVGFCNYVQKCRVKEWASLYSKANEELRTTYVNSWKIVMEFRRSNPKIPALWKRLDTMAKKSAATAIEKGQTEDLELGLPSGRSLLYRDVRFDENGRDVKATVIKYGKPARVKLYGGLICENLVQAVARDVFCECLLRLDDAGYDIALHVHDEAVTEVSQTVEAEVIGKIMSQAPEWMPSLPVASDAKSTMYFTK